MSVKIRLSRGGAKKRPYYYVVVAISTPRDGRYIEQIGTFNPMLKKDDANRVKLKLERVKHWLAVGAQPTDRVPACSTPPASPSARLNNPEKAKPKKKRRSAPPQSREGRQGCRSTPPAELHKQACLAANSTSLPGALGRFFVAVLTGPRFGAITVPANFRKRCSN